MTIQPQDTKTLSRSFAQSSAVPERKTKAKPKRPSPITLRLTPDERAKLEELAQGMTLSAYIRACVLQDTMIARRKSPRRTATKDEETLAQILGLLGQSRIASNLNQLAKAANMGALPVDEETERDLHDACCYVAEMRGLLLKAMGMKESGQ